MSRRTRERKAREKAEADAKKGFFKSWEWKAIRTIFRIVAYLFLLAYLGMTGSLTYTWAQTKYTRLQPIDDAVTVAKQYLYASPQDPEGLRKWLAMRPYSEGEQLMKMMEPYVNRMSGITFILYSGWSAYAHKTEDAVFWRQYARFRIRYDSVRCGSYSAVSFMNDILGDVPNTDVQKYLDEHADQLPNILIRVLQFDKEHPAEDNPTQFCENLTKTQEFRENTKVTMTQPREWPGIYGALRGTTKAEIYGLILEQKKKGIGPEKAGEAPAPKKSDDRAPEKKEPANKTPGSEAPAP